MKDYFSDSPYTNDDLLHFLFKTKGKTALTHVERDSQRLIQHPLKTP